MALLLLYHSCQPHCQLHGIDKVIGHCSSAMPPVDVDVDVDIEVEVEVECIIMSISCKES